VVEALRDPGTRRAPANSEPETKLTIAEYLGSTPAIEASRMRRNFCLLTKTVSGLVQAWLRRKKLRGRVQRNRKLGERIPPCGGDSPARMLTASRLVSQEHGHRFSSKLSSLRSQKTTFETVPPTKGYLAHNRQSNLQHSLRPPSWSDEPMTVPLTICKRNARKGRPTLADEPRCSIESRFAVPD
jgi:hypothetical protein